MITVNEKTLRMKSEKFTGSDAELEDLIACLEFELQQSPKFGVGLSGIQIMIPKKVAIIRIKTKDKKLKRDIETKINLVNAEIIEKTQPFTFKQEGCLSVPNTFLDTKRFNCIKVKNNDGIVTSYSGFIAVAIQHEIDHFNGILFTDRLQREEV